jgi:hypothetical protein
MKSFYGVLIVLFVGSASFGQDAAAFRRLPLKVYRDKMRAAWIGQMVGVGWGAPTEFNQMASIIPADKMPVWHPEWVNQHGNDDCYVEMTFLKTLEDHGLGVSIRQAGIDFANSGYGLAHANLYGRENLRRGIAPPDSGHPKFTQHSDDIDYQIESDYAGIISPGMPNQAVAFGEIFGRLMNYGDGVYGGQFIGAVYFEADFESEPVKVAEAALKSIPAKSQYAEMVRDLLRWHRENPGDWEKTWQLIEKKYHEDANYCHGLCPGQDNLKEFSIDVKLNGAYVLLGLLYGNGDIDKTITIACRAGQDSDCNPSNAAGVLFATKGAANIPARFTEKLDLNAKYSHTEYTLPKVVEVSEKLARAGVVRAGGRIEKDASGDECFSIPVQTPKTSAFLPSYDPGPVENAKYSKEEMAEIKMQPEMK